MTVQRDGLTILKTESTTLLGSADIGILTNESTEYTSCIRNWNRWTTSEKDDDLEKQNACQLPKTAAHLNRP